ncbi:MAG: hypothetical protein B6I34_01400 [Anaerolineaceae bacterium 4572_32.1]|nr:MAG: hypothetical protein B6I34_01400 [Anaerolineaceae bacterium 4572_32.1]
MFRRKEIKRPGLTTVRVAQGLLRAEVYKSKLESAGIPVMLEYESLGPTMGITVDGLGEVRVMVPDDWAAEAQVLLEEEINE